MWLTDSIKNVLGEPQTKGLDLNSEEATHVHERLIREKPFLRDLYISYYDAFLEAHRAAPPGLRLEIGSGGGFFQELLPEVVQFDIRPGAHVTAVASALALPVADNSVGALFLLNVLHHLAEPRLFLREVSRVLKPGGRAVLIEPFVSPLSRRIYGHLHHEPLDDQCADWSLAPSGPMSTANLALPWIIFVRDKARYQREFSSLTIRRVQPHTVLLYLLSGGVSCRTLAPRCAFGPLSRWESRLGPLLWQTAMMMTIELQQHN